MYHGRMDRKVLVDELSGIPPEYFPVHPEGV